MDVTIIKKYKIFQGPIINFKIRVVGEHVYYADYFNTLIVGLDKNLLETYRVHPQPVFWYFKALRDSQRTVFA